MKKSTILIIILVLLFVSSNIFWFFTFIDMGVTQKSQGQLIYELENSKKQAVGILKESLQEKHKNEIKLIAEKYTDMDSFEKGDCIWIGWYGFKFSQSGDLEGIETDESYNNKPICNE